MNPPQSTHLRETAGRECSKLYRPCAYNYYCRTYELSCVFWQPVRHSLFRTRACASPAPRATTPPSPFLFLRVLLILPPSRRKQEPSVALGTCEWALTSHRDLENVTFQKLFSSTQMAQPGDRPCIPCVGRTNLNPGLE